MYMYNQHCFSHHSYVFESSFQEVGSHDSLCLLLLLQSHTHTCTCIYMHHLHTVALHLSTVLALFSYTLLHNE